MQGGEYDLKIEFQTMIEQPSFELRCKHEYELCCLLCHSVIRGRELQGEDIHQYKDSLIMVSGNMSLNDSNF